MESSSMVIRPSSPPPPPPPTYLWEEVKRSKERGEYPWTHLLKPAYSEQHWLAQQDHEYEPIQAPVDPIQAEVGVERQKNVGGEAEGKEAARRREEEERYEVVSPPPEPEESAPATKPAAGRRFIKIPNTEAIIIPLHGSSDEELNPDRYQDPGLVGMGDLEATSPRDPPPAAPPAIRIDAPQAASNQHNSGIQDRIRSQADKLTSKFRNIKKPNISFPKRPMKMPQAPTLNLPERPKIKLPERPKFRLPERPKFHLPERPKFQLPERPKFHLPEKPKFLTERPKIKFPNRPKFGKEKKTIVKGKKPNPSSVRRPLRDKVTISSQSGSSPNIFETLKFRTYPRFFKKKKIREERMSFDTESSLPSTPPRTRSLNTTWVETDIKYVDEENGDQIADDECDDERIGGVRGFEKEETTYHHSYNPEMTKIIPLKATKAESISSEISEKGSSGSSSNRRRAGVIEEIDSDEFFLREKGLSREDVDVSRFLSLEIRDAFRQTKNALASLDGDLNNEDMPEIRFGEIPKPPERKKSIKSMGSEKERSDSELHTFPKRPSRRKQSDPEKPPRRFRSRSGSRYGERGHHQSSMPSLNTGTGEVETECGPQAPERRKSNRSLNREEQVTDLDEDLVLTRIAAQNSCEILPVAPLRKSRSRGTSLADDDRTSRGADSTILPDDDDLSVTREAEKIEVKEVVKTEVKQIQKVEVVVQKKEEREKSVDISGYAVVAKDKKKQPPPRPAQPPRTHFQNQLENIKSHSRNIFFTYPRRAIKSLNKPPVRPVRNYSTLGPLRPPRRRRNRVARTNGHVEETEIMLVENDKERNLKSGEVVMRMKGRPLPPPPRPPRKSKDYDYLPDNETETVQVLLVNGEAEKETEPILLQEHKSSDLKSKRSDFFGLTKSSESTKKKEVNEETIEASVKSHTTAQQTSFDICEVSVSIQTDPLPQDVILVDSQSEIEEGPIKTEVDNRLGESKDSTDVDKKNIKNTQISEQTTQEDTVVKEDKENDKEQTDSNIFQHALKRVEAARGVLQEARERVTPSSLTSRSDDRRSEHQESSFVRIPQRDALLASARSEEIEKEGTPPPLPVRPAYTRPVPVSFPDKLHLSELDVDKLNVSELQANKITVSDIEGGTMQIQEISSRGGNMTIGGIELPPDFISTLVSQVTSQVSAQASPQPSSRDLLPTSRECTPQRHTKSVFTPPPSIIVQATAEPVSKPEPEVPEAGVRESIPRPRTTKSKGRRTPTRVIDDSEDELASIMPARRDEERKKSEERSARSSPCLFPSSPSFPTSPSQHCLPVSRSSPTLSQASSAQLMRRLAVIWQENVVEGTGALVQGVNALFPEGEKRRDAQIAAVILLILVAGLILIGFGYDNTVHHHHWDYVPPR